MKSRFAAVWFILAIYGVKAEGVTPEIFTKMEFNAVTLTKAANHYIDLGETEAIKALKALADDNSPVNELGFNRNERIGWICRIVFRGEERKPLREPGYGGLSLPYLTMPLERWPLYPVAESDSVFFVLAEGYNGTGVPESATSYIDYCSTMGNFLKTKIKEPTHDEAVQAFTALKKSNQWKIIKWKDQTLGTSYSMSEDEVLARIEAQATSIPKSKIEPSGAESPTTQSESNSEGSGKSKPESKEHSR